MDQFGVLHDGQKPYPGAIEAVSQMADAGLTLVILSNSSRRSGGTIKKLGKMGFRESAFAGKNFLPTRKVGKNFLPTGKVGKNFLPTRKVWWLGSLALCQA